MNTIWLEVLVLFALGNGIAWLFGADGKGMIVFWAGLLYTFAILFVIGAVMGLGFKWIAG
jgi:hypothetical protein